MDSKVFHWGLSSGLPKSQKMRWSAMSPKTLSLWEGPKWILLIEIVPFVHFLSLQELCKNGKQGFFGSLEGGQVGVCPKVRKCDRLP